MSKDDPRFLCDLCHTPTDELLFKAPYCAECQAKVRKFRRERKLSRKLTDGMG
jgi:hypothetical protein